MHSNIRVAFRTPNKLFSLQNGLAEFEIQSAVYSKVLRELHGLEDVTMQAACYSTLELPRQPSSSSNTSRSGSAFRRWHLNIIIFGPEEVVDVVGHYLSRNQIYLQDPVDCEREVLYRNPHMISRGEGRVTTGSFKSQPVEVERLSVGPGLLAQLMVEQTPVPETDPHPSVTTTLFR